LISRSVLYIIQHYISVKLIYKSISLMSDNRKSVFLSNLSSEIIGSFSSGRLNSIIERYGVLIKTQNIENLFSPLEMNILFDVSKVSATRERSPWEDLQAKTLVSKIKTYTKCEFNKDELSLKLLNLSIAQEMALVERIEKYWVAERVKLFNEYRESKIKK
jgi:hypothetical protein